MPRPRYINRDAYADMIVRGVPKAEAIVKAGSRAKKPDTIIASYRAVEAADEWPAILHAAMERFAWEIDDDFELALHRARQILREDDRKLWPKAMDFIARIQGRFVQKHEVEVQVTAASLISRATARLQASDSPSLDGGTSDPVLPERVVDVPFETASNDATPQKPNNQPDTDTTEAPEQLIESNDSSIVEADQPDQPTDASGESGSVGDHDGRSAGSSSRSVTPTPTPTALPAGPDSPDDQEAAQDAPGSTPSPDVEPEPPAPPSRPRKPLVFKVKE